MWVYLGHQLVVTLSDGSTVEGRLSWCWARGFWRLRDPKDLGSGDEIQGALLVPIRSVVVAQVI